MLPVKERRSDVAVTAMRFKDREEAALELARSLGRLKLKNPLVLAIPRGGVPMGKIISERVGGDLDLMLVKKVGHPWNPEFAIASVTEEGELILGDGAEKYGFSAEDLTASARETADLLRRRRELYTRHSRPPDPRGRSVVLVDDGIATGMTVAAAIHDLRNKGADRILVATPVSTAPAAQRIKEAGAELIALDIPENFVSVSQVYRDFSEVTDLDVILTLESVSEGAPHVPL